MKMYVSNVRKKVKVQCLLHASAFINGFHVIEARLELLQLATRAHVRSRKKRRSEKIDEKVSKFEEENEKICEFNKLNDSLTLTD